MYVYILQYIYIYEQQFTMGWTWNFQCCKHRAKAHRVWVEIEASSISKGPRSVLTLPGELVANVAMLHSSETAEFEYNCSAVLRAQSWNTSYFPPLFATYYWRSPCSVYAEVGEDSSVGWNLAVSPRCIWCTWWFAQAKILPAVLIAVVTGSTLDAHPQSTLFHPHFFWVIWDFLFTKIQILLIIQGPGSKKCSQQKVIMMAIGKMWSSATDEEKKRFQDASEKLREGEHQVPNGTDSANVCTVCPLCISRSDSSRSFWRIIIELSHAFQLAPPRKLSARFASLRTP